MTRIGTDTVMDYGIGRDVRGMTQSLFAERNWK